jgi:GT2 family glycosyltransferase/SAM-dependent methyltransferase
MVAAVVLSWNGREDTLACLESLAAVTYPALSVVVVDNGSNDGSPEAIAEQHPHALLVPLGENRGFAGGMNAGIERALQEGAQHVLLLNNDMTFEPGFVEPLVDAVADDVAAVCAQILFAEPPPRVWYAGADYDPRRGYQGRHHRYGEPPLPAETSPYPTGRACGGAMLVPRSVVERLGGFDERLFAYAEDVEWSLRARREGLSILVAPASIVRHRVSASTGGVASPSTVYYALRNGLAVAEQAAPLGRPGTWRRRLVALAASLAQVATTRDRLTGSWAAIRAIRDVRRDRLGAAPPLPALPLVVRDPGLWMLLHVRPIGDRLGDSHGMCAVCGNRARFYRNRWVMPADLRRIWPAEMVDKESQMCDHCGSSGRVRALAAALLGLYGDQAKSVVELVREPTFRSLRVVELNGIGRMHPYLAAHPQLTYCEYPDEDLQALSFPDGSYDLVLTSETLEHVPDLDRALRETYRILSPGGRHVFTVPLDPRRETTRSRIGLPAQHHGRGGGPFALVTRRVDMLAHWDIGRDIVDHVRMAGFDVEVVGDGVGVVYVARKPERCLE